MSGTAGDMTALGRLGGLTTVSRYSPDAVAARARAGLWQRFLNEADPAGKLSDAERERRAKFVQRAYYVRLALKSAHSRKTKTTASGTAAVQEDLDDVPIDAPMA